MSRILAGLAAPALAACTLMALPTASHADLSYNLGVTSDYRYRGISQTRLKPALQGGLDYTAGAFYAGAWVSTIKWVKDAGGDASVEVDLYGGVKGEVVKDLAYDVGMLRYQYPGNKLKPIGGADANTTEVYGALTYGPATLKYSYSLGDTFGNLRSKGSSYLDLSASFDVGGVAVAPHVGHQKIDGPLSGPASYTDYSLTVSKDFSGVVLSVAWVGTDADKSFYTSAVGGKKLGKSGVVLGAKYNF